MYRTNELNKLNNDIDQDETYEFTGATLKISTDDTNQDVSTLRYRNNTRKDDGIMEKSAILSGSDISSPPPMLEDDYYDSIGAEDEKKESTPLKPDAATQAPETFFAFRNGQFQKTVDDCVQTLLRPTNDTQVLGSWLLTEVSHWDTEKERVFILTSKSLLQVKYDFIALKILQHNKVRLEQIDTVLKGKLAYPVQSLVPRIEGITNGVASFISGSIFGFKKNATDRNYMDTRPNQPKTAIANRFDFSGFRPVERKDFGVRVLWNRGQPLSLLSSWNPFADDIPWVTIKDHPLYNSLEQASSLQPSSELDKLRNIYSVESLYNKLIAVFSASNPDSVNFNCCFEDCPILMENYVGIGAVIHNKNNFGFFKCRGKFSF
ncbi:tumor protein p63-regulated gene 1-like protein [Condylostylus longicornis]|uniref:tumor protein p63-regulated gene 1-like protein n=1 Tax=Condylostylus longicornis TaxID=2530218 RepID=UPI00244E32A2|nr:tumor protein p63-regulated gene 1-like protein [Condylostylus longicornis]